MLGMRSLATYGFGLIACVGLSGAAVVVAVDQTALVTTLSSTSAIPLFLAGLIGCVGVLTIGERPSSARGKRVALNSGD